MDEAVYTSCDFIAGWTAGVTGLVIGHPLDTIKVRLQTFKNAKAWNIARKTWQYEGIYGFYKGMGFPLLTAGALNSLFFGVYASTLRYIEKYHNPSDPDDHGHKYLPYSYTNICLAGAIGGLASCTISTPVDLIKIQLQAQTGLWEEKRKLRHVSPINLLVKYYSKYGIKGLYHGGLTMVYRETSSFAIYVWSYAEMMTRIPGEVNVFSVMLAGGTAVPLDVIKTRLQSDDLSAPEYKGIVDCAVKSYKKDGILIFQRGLVMCCVRSFPVNAATFVGYEWCLKLCTEVIDTYF